MKRRLAIIATSLSFLGMAGSAFGQSTYPDHPVRVVVGVAPGQSTDVLARILASQLSKQMGQQFYIENKAGAGATLAPDTVSKAKPDGYTLMITSAGPLAISPALQRKLPYDPLKDFAAVGNAFTIPLFLVANKETGFNGLQDLIAYAKANPGKLNYASTGTGTTGHLAMELFKSAAAIDLTHVPYKGAPAAMTDLLGGLVQLTFDFGPVVLPQAANGKIKIIGIASSKRSSAAPTIPTLAEQGLSSFRADTFIAAFAPAGTSAEIISKLNREINLALSTPEVKEVVQRMAGEVSGDTPQQLQELLVREHAMWGKLIRDANVRGE